MAVWSKNERISGKRINSIIGKAKAVDNPRVPLKGGKTIGMAGWYNPHMKVGSEKDDLFWLDGDGEIYVKNIDEVVGPREEAEIEIRDGRLWLTQGKHQCWFEILPSEMYGECISPESVKATFTVDPSLIADMSKRAKYVRIEVGTNKVGERTVLVVYYDRRMKFINGIDLKTGWEGEPVAAAFNAEDVSKWKGLGTKAQAKIFDDYDRTFPGIELEGSDNGVSYDYFLPTNAKIIGAGQGYSNDGYFSDEERDWYMSCNRKQSKAKHRRC